jgi:hypothetical protein
MKKEDYLESDDIEIATLYANIIYQDKGKEYLVKTLKNQDKYFLEIEYWNNNKITLYKRNNGLYYQIKSENIRKLPKYEKEKIIETINKIFNNP